MSFITCPLLIILYNITTHNMCNKYDTIRYNATKMTMMITAFWNVNLWVSATPIKEAQVLQTVVHIYCTTRHIQEDGYCQIGPISLKSHFPLSSHFCLDLPSGPLLSGSPRKLCTSPIYMSHALPIIFSWYVHPNYIWWVYTSWCSFLTMQFPPVSCNPFLFNTNIFHNTLHSSLNIRDQVSQQHKTTVKYNSALSIPFSKQI